MSAPETNIGGLPSYAALMNLKKVIPSASAGYFAVENHMFNDLMGLFLRNVFVDQSWYLEKNPDIREAIENKAVLDARDHFIRFGFYEHRAPYPIEVDESWYTSSYPDVSEAIANKVFPSAQHHFDLVGYREGRLPFENFALRTR